MNRAFIVLTVAIAAVASVFSLTAARSAAWRLDVPAGAAPVVVELFTSEGCSSCPPADAFLAELASTHTAGVPVIVLSEHVDYWNRQGWTDPFSSAAFTARQQDYARRLQSEVYTPQMVIDGRWQFVGSDRGSAATALHDAALVAKPHASVTARSAGGDVLVHVEVSPADAATAHAAAPLPDADVMVAVTEDGLTSAVTAGENQGRRLGHTGVTRVLKSIGRTRRGAPSAAFDASLPLDPHWALEHVRVVAFLQEKKDGAIVGAASAAIGPQRDARLEGR